MYSTTIERCFMIEASGMHRWEAFSRQAIGHVPPLACTVGPHGFLKEASTCRIEAGGRLCGGTGDRGARWPLEPASASHHDLGGDDAAEAMAGGRLLSLHSAAQKVAVSPLHHAEAAGGDARDQRQDRRLVAQVYQGLSGVLGGR